MIDYRWIGLLATAMIANIASAQIEPTEEGTGPATVSGFEFQALGGVWLPQLGGTSRFGTMSTADKINLDSDLSLGGSETVPTIELLARWNDYWQLRLSAFDFSRDTAGTFTRRTEFGDVALRNGDEFLASVDMLSTAVEFGIDAWRPIGSSATNSTHNNENSDLHFTPIVGVRYLDIDQSLELVSGGRAEAGGEWAALYGGLELHLEYRPKDQLFGLRVFEAVRIDGGLGIGPAFGGDGGHMWQVSGGLTIDVTENLGFMFGYRLVELNAETDDFEFDAGLQGLFLAGSVSF